MKLVDASTKKGFFQKEFLEGWKTKLTYKSSGYSYVDLPVQEGFIHKHELTAVAVRGRESATFATNRKSTVFYRFQGGNLLIETGPFMAARSPPFFNRGRHFWTSSGSLRVALDVMTS
jgi:hypothetical protein